MQSRRSAARQLAIHFSTGMQLSAAIALTCIFVYFLRVNQPCGGYRETVPGKSCMSARRVYLRVPSAESSVSAMR